MDIKRKNTKQRLKGLKVISNDNLTILFDKETLNLRLLAPEPAKKLDLLIQNIDLLPEDSRHWNMVSEITDYFNDFKLDIPEETEGLNDIDKPVSEIEKIRSKVHSSRYLNKLSLNTANSCNLRCTYCYANMGLYGTPQQFLMSTEDVEITIKRFAERFDYIEKIQFMGGEPSLNPQAIEKTAQIFNRLADQEKLAGTPELGIVSNGVKFSPRFWGIVRKYDVHITFSLDGPREIHDHIRLRPSGGGSYDSIIKNINRAMEMGIKTDFEATFSKRHLDCGVSMIDLCKWFFEQFGHRVLHAPIMSENRYGTQPLALTKAEKTHEYTTVTKWGLENLLKHQILMHGFTHRFLQSFQEKEKKTSICPAGSGLLSVSTKGDVYPCWMFCDEKPFYMGNVKKDDFLGVRGAAVLQVLDQYDLDTHPECQKCWIQSLCFGCKGANWHATETIDKMPDCGEKRAMVETFILEACQVFIKLKIREKEKGVSVHGVCK